LNSSRIRLAAAVALALALGFAWRWWASAERRLDRAFDALLASVAKDGPENQLDRLGHARDFAERFARDFVVSAKPYSGTLTDRQQLMGVVDGYRSGAERVSAVGTDREWTLRDNGTADLYALVELDGASRGGPGRERFRVRIAWVEEDGEWRIAEAEVLERLESSGLF
jgi:hypothetical protein